jgi:hypothetical protein
MQTQPRPFLPSDTASRVFAHGEFAKIVRSMLIGGRDEMQPLSSEIIRNGSERLRLATRAVVGGGSLTDAEAVGAFRQVSLAWLQALRFSGAFDSILGAGDFRISPMMTRFGISTVAIIGDLVAEGRGIGVKQLHLAPSGPLRPRKTAAIVVITKELSRVSEAEALVDQELRSAVAAGADRVFLSELLGAVTPLPSTGGSTGDFAALLQAVPTGRQSRLRYILHPDLVKFLVTERDANKAALWPDLDLRTGGQIYGAPVDLSDQIAADAAMILDASQVAANQGEVEVAVSGQASVEMADPSSQDALAGTGATLTSLFQSNSSGIRAVRSFAFELLRAESVAAITGIAWGSAGP